MRWRFGQIVGLATKARKAESGSAPSARPVSILERYKQFQGSHPEHIVLMQVGDFFEIYGEAVEAAAKILDISTTRAPGKLVGNDESVPMTGFPVRSFETYLGKLIKAGKSVVVAEQFPVPLSARFDRQITRIVTPGTVVEEHLLDRGLNNYILLIASNGLVLSWMDVSTGDFWVSQVSSQEELLALLARLRPREILFSQIEEELMAASLQQFAQKNGIASKQIQQLSSTREILVDPDWKPSKAEIACSRQLAAHVQVNTLLSLSLKPLRQFTSQQGSMMIDASSFRSLDILVNNSNSNNQESSSTSTSLLATLDECRTALGSRLLRRRLQAPMTGVEEITRALNGVDVFFNCDPEFLTELHKKLDQIADMERILQRLLLFRPQGVARDLRSLSKSLLMTEECFQVCQLSGIHLASSLESLAKIKSALMRVLSFVAEEKVPLRDSEGGFIRSGVDAELDELRQLRDDSSSVFASLEASYRQLSGIPNLRIVSFKGDQQVIEVPKSTILQMTHESKSKAVGFDIFPSILDFKPLMQTETKARFITDELVNKSFLLRSVNERVIERELLLLDELRAPLLEAVDLIRKVCEEVAQLDLNSSLAVIAQKYNYTKPKIISSSLPILRIIDGRHPILDRKFFDSQPPQHFTPNSLELNEQSKPLIHYLLVLTRVSRSICFTYRS